MLNNQAVQIGDRITISNFDGINSSLVISKAKIEDSGTYFCRAWNEYGYHERNITLRVKSYLAPLWPFLGVVGEFSIIALIIGLYELSARKKEQSNGNPQM